jgi:hypothetical protein
VWCVRTVPESMPEMRFCEDTFFKSRCPTAVSELCQIPRSAILFRQSTFSKAGAHGRVRTVSEPYVFGLLGLAFERKQMPQVIGNDQKRKEAIEVLELYGEFAKQVLSQLSYTDRQIVEAFWP